MKKSAEYPAEPANSHELLRQFQNGDSQVAAAIFDRYVRRLLALARMRIGTKLARRIDADDVVQSAYRSFFIHAENDEYVLTRSGDLWRLLASITLHKLYRQLETHTAARRSIKREDLLNSYETNSIPAPAPTPAEVIAILEELQLVARRLTPAERSVLTLRLQGQSVEQIAGVVQKSQRTVRRLLAQSRQKIEQQLIAKESFANRWDTAHSVHVTESLAPLNYSNYVLERLLGAGGMGKVYRATQRSTRKLVAIKALLKSRQSDRHAVEKFLQEAQILARLNHPGIVGVHGVGRFPGGGYFIAMDFVDGIDLQSRLAKGPLPIAAAVRIVRKVTAAIAHAHEQGIVHGDLKPANVLVDKFDRVVVTDFGLAQFIVNESHPQEPHWIVGGTAGYIAPEVRMGGQAPGPAADIYGLGALLWALTSGSAPDGDVCGIHTQSESISALCAKCLSAKPTHRIQCAKDLEKELNSLKVEASQS